MSEPPDGPEADVDGRSEIDSETDVTNGDGRRELTLAFSLAALDRLAEPAAAFADAGEWSRYLGLIDNDTEAVAERVDEHDLRQDYDLGDRDKWLALSEIRRATAGRTDRHVYVGRTEDDRMAAEGTGWEFVPVHEAAEKAEWVVEGDRRDDVGLLERLRSWLP